MIVTIITSAFTFLLCVIGHLTIRLGETRTLLRAVQSEKVQIIKTANAAIRQPRRTADLVAIDSANAERGEELRRAAARPHQLADPESPGRPFPTDL